MEKKDVTHFIDDHRQEILKDLAEFIAIDSVSSNKEKINEAMDFILKLAHRMELGAESLLDGQVGVIEAGEGSETLGILSHLDVVSPGESSQWNSDPFKAVIKDGKIYGRGTLDDKGMIIASLYAMKAASESGIPLKKKVQLIIGTQEEVKWTDMDAYVKKYPLPDYGFTPDGEYPICNIEKGSLDILMEFELSPDNGQAAGKNALVSIEAGTASNIVPGSALAKFSDGQTITVQGKAVHSCQPERGDNSIFKLFHALSEREVEKNSLYELLAGITKAFDDIYGRALGLYSASEYYQGEYVHRNVFSPTIFKAEGSKATVNVNCRFPYGSDEKEILSAMENFCTAHGGKIINTDFLPAVFVSKDKPFLKVLAAAYEEITGLKNDFTLAYGGSYAKAMPNVVSWGPIFPGEEDTCHEPNEYIGIESLMTSAKIFAKSIADIAFSEESFK